MGSIPKNCDEKFEVSSSGSSREEAKENALKKANDLCERLKKNCDEAHEVGEGSYRETDGLFTYTSEYICPKNS